MKIRLIFLLFALYSAINGQVTITKSDFEAQFAVGNTIDSYWDTLTTSVNIGQKGMTNWDFSSLTPQVTFPSQSIDPGTSAYGNEFPSAEYAFYYEGVFAGVLSRTWSYLSLPGDFTIHGTATEANTQAGNLFATNKYNPGELTYKLPMTFGDSWSYEGVLNTATTVGGFPFNSSSDIEASYSVDAYGTMTMPGGKVVEAIRVKSVTTQTTEIVPGFPNTTISVGYDFIAKTGEFVAFDAVNENDPDEGTIQVTGITWQDGSGATNIEDNRELVINQFTLKQNYPNPFNPTTTIEYSIPKTSEVELKIYNSIGAEITTLVNQSQGVGNYSIQFNASNLPSGIYFARLNSEGFSQTIKMTLMK